MTFPDLSQSSPQNGARFSGLADWVTGWSYPSATGIWLASIEWTGTGAPTGELYLEINGSGELPTPDPDQTIRLVLPAGTPGTYGSWPSVAGVAGNAAIMVKNPFPAQRIGYVAAGGGAVSQFRVRLTKRGA